MSYVSIIVLCASALFVQTTYAQCLCAAAPCLGAPAAFDPYSWGPGCCAPSCGNICGSNVAAASGGCFDVITTSLYAPIGLSVRSDNDISGILDTSGHLPVLAAVTLEDTLPTGGSAGTSYSCGNGQVGINSDSIAAAGINGAGYGAEYAFGLGAYGHGAYAPGAYGAIGYGPCCSAAPCCNAAPCGCY